MTIQYICQSCGEEDCVTSMVPVCWDPEHQEWLPDSNDIALAGYRCLQCNSWEVERVCKASTSSPNQQDGLNLKLKRVQAGLTLWQLGKLAGVHPARISEMERGQRPITDVVVDALGNAQS